MNLSPLGQAIYGLIRADRACAGPVTLEQYCDDIERELQKLIRQELIAHRVLAERDSVD